MYRQINCNFWVDNKVLDEFSPEDKLVYLYLMTNKNTTMIGCYEISIKQISYETGYSKESVAVIMDRLEHIHKVIQYDSETHEVFIPNWCKYQWKKSPAVKTGLLKEVGNIKSENFANAVVKRFNSYFSDDMNIMSDDIGIIPDDIDIMSDDMDIMSDHMDIMSESEEKEKEKENNNKNKNNKKKNKSSKDDLQKKVKHHYGEFNNVMLSDEDMEALIADYGKDTIDEYIVKLDEYIENKGVKYRNHRLTIRKWLGNAKTRKGSGESTWNW